MCETFWTLSNAIRPTAVGKKNFLFVGSADAGHRNAILYALVEACRRRHIDPYSYLLDVLSRLPSMTNWQIKAVTPEAWAKVNGKNYNLLPWLRLRSSSYLS